MTTDTKAAASFYQRVIGWDAEDSGMPGRSYTLLSMGLTMVGGLMPITEDARNAGVRPAWMGYIGVPDVDDYAKRVEAAGGAIHRDPKTFQASVVSPSLPIRRALASCSSPERRMKRLRRLRQECRGMWDGTNCMRATANVLSGFIQGCSAGRRPRRWTWVAMGLYQVFSIDKVPTGGIMTKTPQMPAPMWVYYFNVDVIDAAIKRVRRPGAKLHLALRKCLAAAGSSSAWIPRAHSSH